MSGALKEVRNRLKSVQSSQQITKAMKMVSAAKLRRAQDAIVQMRPYPPKLQEMLSNIVSYNAVGHLPAIISGIPGHAIEDVKISNLYLQHRGGAAKEMAAFEPPEDENKYPDPHMFGPELPAHGVYIRHAKNLEFSNVEVAYEAPDERSAFIVNDVQGADFFRIKTPPESRGRVFSLTNVTDFRTLATPGVKDTQLERVEAKAF